jgi:hypothetical protein
MQNETQGEDHDHKEAKLARMLLLLEEEEERGRAQVNC